MASVAAEQGKVGTVCGIRGPPLLQGSCWSAVDREEGRYCYDVCRRSVPLSMIQKREWFFLFTSVVFCWGRGTPGTAQCL